MASVRSLDNCLELDWNQGVGTPLVQKITEDDGTTIIPDNGRIIRNLIHGADTVMSHITHFYALAALDYVNASILGTPFAPTYTAGVQLLPATLTMPNGQFVVSNYVESLTMRRKAHTMSAILSGRHPIQNAIVPGGATTLPTTTDIAQFSNLLDTVRNFINTAYIPDVVSVATLGAPYNYSAHWTTGTQPGNLLSYGDYPIQTGTNPEVLLFPRAMIQGGGGAPFTVHTDGTGTPTNFLGNVHEYVGYSYYSSPSGLHPSAGQTEPDVSLVNPANQQYSWLKAPRFGIGSLVCEVGPLPRMVAAYARTTGAVLGGPLDPVVSGAKDPAGTVTVAPLYGLGAFAGTYNVSTLVTGALNLVLTPALPIVAAPTHLVSTLGRHAARALECKLLADAMANTQITSGEAWLSQLTQGGRTLSSPTYIYAKLPKQPKSGAGWAEAPRGALGHWISTDKKRIDNYQCVVPSTWNHSPRDDSGILGAAEQVIRNFGALSPSGNTDEAVMNCLRLLHPYDFCIACAVHLVRPDGSTIAKVKMDTDGKVTKLPNDAEI
jgi:hydrogenase large subunit